VRYFSHPPPHCSLVQDRRWDADYLTLSKILDQGLLGRVAEFETHFDRHKPVADKTTWKGNPAPGGGVVYDLGTHLMDQVVHRFGMPQRITGFVSAQREGNDNGVDDACTILLHYDGMLATVKAGVVSPEVEQLRYWVRGTKGSFKKVRLREA
jgi:predicted dehydrogenase